MTAARYRLGPWQLVVGVLVLMHLAIVGLYSVGLAVSRVPFTNQGVQTVITSPVPPISHALGAILLALAAYRTKFRDLGAVVSASVWVAYATTLVFSSVLRHPPLAPIGGVLAFGFAILAVSVALFWNEQDDLAE